jgi:multidrug efflux pump subunit AcrB
MFTAAGAAVCVVAVIFLFRRWRWTSVAVLALVLNLAALSTWGYWIGNRMLLPYDQFCDKVGMP